MKLGIEGSTHARVCVSARVSDGDGDEREDTTGEASSGNLKPINPQRARCMSAMLVLVLLMTLVASRHVCALTAECTCSTLKF